MSSFDFTPIHQKFLEKTGNQIALVLTAKAVVIEAPAKSHEILMFVQGQI